MSPHSAFVLQRNPRPPPVFAPARSKRCSISGTSSSDVDVVDCAKDENNVDLINIDFEKLIKTASSHLMLPAFFINVQKKNLTHLFPDDFIDYIQNIYSINKARNEVLLTETKQLSELLHKNNINHIFLKGSALLLANIFEDIGERMIGDIDFMIQKKDETTILRTLKENNYISHNREFKLFKHKHLSRHTHK